MERYRIEFRPAPRLSIPSDRLIHHDVVVQFEEGAATLPNQRFHLPIGAVSGIIHVEAINLADETSLGTAALSLPKISVMTAPEIFDRERLLDVWNVGADEPIELQDWRQLLGLDRITVTSDRLRELAGQPEAIDTLRSWLMLGSTLIVQRQKNDDDTVSQVFGLRREDFEQDDQRSKQRHLRFGVGLIIELDPTVDNAVVASDAAEADAIVTSPMKTVDEFSANRSTMVRIGVDPVLGSLGYGRWLIPGVAQPPVFPFIFALAIFVILVGPVAYRLTVGTGRGHLIFVVAPVLALITTTAMFAYGLLSDGLGIKGRIRQVTYLDSYSTQALTRSRETYFSGRSYNRVIELPPQAVFVDYARGSTGFRYNREPTVVASFIAEKDQLFLGADWLQARQQKQCIWIAPRKVGGGLEMQRSPTNPEQFTLTNRTDQAFVELHVGLPEGKAIGSLAGQRLDPGQSAVLSIVEEDEALERMRLMYDPFRPINTGFDDDRRIIDNLEKWLGAGRVRSDGRLSTDANDSFLEYVLYQKLTDERPLKTGEFVAMTEIRSRDKLVPTARLSDSVSYWMGTVLYD